MNEYKIGGKQIWLLTISELSRLVGLRPRTLRIWEHSGVLPKPTYTQDMHSPVVGKCSRRLYLECQAQALFAWVERIRPGRGVHLTEAMIKLLHEIWQKATENYLKGEEDVRDKNT